MTLWESFQLGGWSMWPILVFGILGVTAAARFLFRCDLRLEAFARWMALTTMLSASLGFFTSMISVARYIEAHAKNGDDRFAILIEGTAEALNNITLGLILTTLACLILAVGHRRLPVRV
jgi:hypothetical protein